MADKPFNSGGGSGYGSFPEVEGVAGAAAEINRLQDEELKRHDEAVQVQSWTVLLIFFTEVDLSLPQFLLPPKIVS